MEQIIWSGDHGSDVRAKKLRPEDGHIYEQALSARGVLSEQLADCDNELAELIISEGSNREVPEAMLKVALRRAILDLVSKIMYFFFLQIIDDYYILFILHRKHRNGHLRN